MTIPIGPTNSVNLTIALNARRSGLHAAIEGGETSHQLSRRLEEIAEAEGHLHTYSWLLANATNLLENTTHMETDDLVAALTETAFDLVSAGADDTWSGRSNDIRRARFDGIREMVKNQTRHQFKSVLAEAWEAIA